MRFKSIFFCLLFLSVFFVFTVHFSLSQDIDELLTKWEKQLKDQNLITCDIKQTKSTEFLVDEVSLHGTFHYKYPHFFRIKLKGDENYELYCDGQTIHIIDHDLGEVKAYDFEDLTSQQGMPRLLIPVLGETKTEIKNNYEITYDESKDQYRLEPKGTSNLTYKSIAFRVDQRDRIQWMKVTYSNHDWTETEFKNWKEHGPVSDYFFKYLK
ncbi:MAG: hypothetical protein GF421_13310 [Candidatus Aminicenantes bacterium]|nr:hypothetical protein [Candidatus Aminicenantes bacterium]